MSKSDPGHIICFYQCNYNSCKDDALEQYYQVQCKLGYKQNPKTPHALTNALKNNAEVCERLKREL